MEKLYFGVVLDVCFFTKVASLSLYVFLVYKWLQVT